MKRTAAPVYQRPPKLNAAQRRALKELEPPVDYGGGVDKMLDKIVRQVKNRPILEDAGIDVGVILGETDAGDLIVLYIGALDPRSHEARVIAWRNAEDAAEAYFPEDGGEVLDARLSDLKASMRGWWVTSEGFSPAS